MKFHGVNIVGKLRVQRVATLPTFDTTLLDGRPSDEGRFLYAEDVDGLFHGTSVGWSGSPTIIDSATNTQSDHYSKIYRLIVWEGNIQLQEIDIV